MQRMAGKSKVKFLAGFQKEFALRVLLIPEVYSVVGEEFLIELVKGGDHLCC
jgi:hypothetical protein